MHLKIFQCPFCTVRSRDTVQLIVKKGSSTKSIKVMENGLQKTVIWKVSSNKSNHKIRVNLETERSEPENEGVI